jgi:phytoene dehydrogenase-like protein
MLGYADYRGPIAGVDTCGSGIHPGVGVSGVPGHNAVHEVLRDVAQLGRGGTTRDHS